jgi:hypothetical protein
MGTLRWQRVHGIACAKVEFVRPFKLIARAFSSEVDTGSREENASNEESGAAVPVQSERRLQNSARTLSSMIPDGGPCPNGSNRFFLEFGVFC